MYSWTSSGVPRRTVIYSLPNVLSNFDYDIRSSAITQPRMKPNRTVISETITVVAVPRKKY